MLKRPLTAAAVVVLAMAPALAAETVDRETLRGIVDLYKTEFGQTSTGLRQVLDPAEIRPGGWTNKWDEKAEKSVAAHRARILKPATVGTEAVLVIGPKSSAEDISSDTLRDIVEMYKTQFNQSSTGKPPTRDAAEIRPGGWTDKWDEKAEKSIDTHRNQILGRPGGQV